MTDLSSALRVAIFNDHELVIRGLEEMLEPFAQRVRVVDVVAGEGDGPRLSQAVEVLLIDTFAATGVPDRVARLNAKFDGVVVVYTWTFDPEAIALAFEAGASGYLSKGLTAERLVDALERIAAGEAVRSPEPRTDSVEETPQEWPGRSMGLSEREAEVLTLVASGRSNDHIAATTSLSINTVKSYIRTAYGKIGAHSRSQAVLWAVDYGLNDVDARRYFEVLRESER